MVISCRYASSRDQSSSAMAGIANLKCIVAILNVLPKHSRSNLKRASDFAESASKRYSEISIC
jgi:hypothetical protein